MQLLENENPVSFSAQFSSKTILFSSITVSVLQSSLVRKQALFKYKAALQKIMVSLIRSSQFSVQFSSIIMQSSSKYETSLIQI